MGSPSLKWSRNWYEQARITGETCLLLTANDSMTDYKHEAWNESGQRFVKWLIQWAKNPKVEEALRAAAARILARAAFPEERIPSLRKQLQVGDVIPALIELAKLGRLPCVKAINLADITIVEHLDTGGYRGKLNDLPIVVHVWPGSMSVDTPGIREQVGYLSFLTHPNLLQFYGASLDTSDLSIAREYVRTCALALATRS